MRLGIDLGTTRTVVAVCDRGNYPVLRFTLEGGDAVDGVPTIVAARGSELRFGLDALAVAEDPSFELLRSFKRVLGEPGGHERMLTLAGREFSAAELLVGFLAHLREAILHRSNLPKKKKKSEALEAVIATPANALGAQRFLTLEAFRKAGFTVSATLNEPSAAGFEYSHAHPQTITGKRTHVVVYDLGGGTFDASLVRVTELKHDAVITAGVATLGGDDFDRVLLDLALAEANIDSSMIGDPIRSLEICREAKERLHPNSKKIALELPGIGDVSIATAAYYSACEPLVERTIEAMLPVMNRLESSLVESADPLDDIAGIYVVGGASALPIVGRMLRERFGRRVHRSPYPSAATAVGLAIAADDQAGFALEDRFSRSFGVFRDQAGEVAFDVIFDRETALPKKKEQVTVERRYRVAHDIGHFRFLECTGVDRKGAPEGDLSLFVDVRFPFVADLQGDDAPLGERPVHRLSSLGTTVCEHYELDAHGLVRLSLTDEATGYTRDFTLR